MPPRDASFILIPAGVVQIGDNTGPPGEFPVFQYKSRALLMGRTAVTVAENDDGCEVAIAATVTYDVCGTPFTLPI